MPKYRYAFVAPVAKSVDAPDLGSGVEKRAGSIPVGRTILPLQGFIFQLDLSHHWKQKKAFPLKHVPYEDNAPIPGKYMGTLGNRSSDALAAAFFMRTANLDASNIRCRKSICSFSEKER